MADYVEKTIAAYNLSPDKYQNSTQDMAPMPEIQRFVNMTRKVGNTVLDAGCAFGRDTILLNDYGLEATGIDLSEELLSKAESLHPKLKFRKMDLRQLSFKDESFSGVWAHAVLLHLDDDDLLKALYGLNRVLKTGGVLFASFKKGKGTEEVMEAFSSDASRFYNFQTQETLATTLECSNFAQLNIYDWNEKEHFSDKRDLDWIFSFSVKQ